MCYVIFVSFDSFRIGEQNKGSRYLTFVEAMTGFRHLLTQQDLDKAASLCKSLRGCLRSRFIVLSDDREARSHPPRGSSKRSADDAQAEDVMDTEPPSKK